MPVVDASRQSQHLTKAYQDQCSNAPIHSWLWSNHYKTICGSGCSLFWLFTGNRYETVVWKRTISYRTRRTCPSLLPMQSSVRDGQTDQRSSITCFIPVAQQGQKGAKGNEDAPQNDAPLKTPSFSSIERRDCQKWALTGVLLKYALH